MTTITFPTPEALIKDIQRRHETKLREIAGDILAAMDGWDGSGYNITLHHTPRIANPIRRSLAEKLANSGWSVKFPAGKIVIRPMPR